MICTRRQSIRENAPGVIRGRIRGILNQRERRSEDSKAERDWALKRSIVAGSIRGSHRDGETQGRAFHLSQSGDVLTCQRQVEIELLDSGSGRWDQIASSW